MAKIPKTLPTFLWHYICRYKVGIIGQLVVAIFYGLYISLNPYLLKVIIDTVIEAENQAVSIYHAVLYPAVLYVLLGLAAGLIFRFNDWMIIRTFPPMKKDISKDMFEYVQGHSYSYFQHHFSGSTANKINDMTTTAINLINNSIDVFISRILSLLIGAVTMYLVNPAFALLLIVWSVIFLAFSLLFTRRSQDYAEVYSEARSSVVGKIVDSLSNILTVKLFAREKYESQYLNKFLDRAVDKDRKLQWYLLVIKTIQSIAIAVLIAGMLWLLIKMRAENKVTVGDFALILTLTMTLIDEIYYVAKELVNFSEDLGRAKQALSIMTTKHDLVDKQDASLLKVPRGEIIFDNVTFKYRDGHTIFKDQTLVIAPGEKVGLVGFSGSGKSTLVNLILRFFEVTSGRILIDGQDIKNVTQESLRSQIALIPQDPVLFHRPLIENLRYGRLEATDEEVIDAARKAHCDLFIEKMKDGYRSMVGERGVKLSGGQRQRIAIARAILKNAPILILDEATSALDSVTENEIQDSLNQLMEGRTTIVVAHRLSTLFNMDRILVFHEGQIIEEGSHAELIELEGYYAHLWNMQAGGFLVGDEEDAEGEEEEEYEDDEYTDEDETNPDAKDS